MAIREAVAAAAMLLALAAGQAMAQAYPAKPVRIVVPYTPGSATDSLARLLAQKLSERWGQQAVVENVVGANGMVGTEQVAKAAKDGYTLAMIAANHAVSGHLFKNLPYDPVNDFAAIGIVGQVPFLLAVHPSVPFNDLAQLTQHARANPGKLNYASAGNGSPPHLAAELLKAMAKVDILHVPYKGVTPAITDLIGGQVHMSFGAVPVVLPHVKAGKLRALGVSSLKRSESAPEIPTLDEQGLGGFEVVSWIGLVAPAGTPAAVIDKVHGDISAVLAMPDVRTRIAGLGVELVGGSPAQMQRTLAVDAERWGKIVRQSGAKMD